MNNKICENIKFMLSGMISRIIENKDFIKEVSFNFKSGLKNYTGYYDVDNEEVVFIGIKEKLIPNKLPEFIGENSLKYDSLEFKLLERGKTTILYADLKGVKMKHMDEEDTSFDEGKASMSLKRDYIIKIGEADDLLKAIGILGKDGKLKNDMIRKYNQIDHFVELVEDMLSEINEGTINVLDCGCGKSYLTFVLNYYLKEKKKRNCFFIGIDRSKNVIEKSREIAKGLNYKNMQFIEADLHNYIPDRRVDMVISLHACDIATDLALSTAVRNKAKAIICVPCCHKELIDQIKFDEFEPILKHGVFKARFSDLLTDGIRSLILESHGYKVTTVEYISPLETPKNLMIRGVKVSEGNDTAREEYYEIKRKFSVYPALERFIDGLEY